MPTPVQLVLSNFAASVRLDYAGTFQTESVPTFDSSATAILQVPLSSMTSCFKYDADSIHMLDGSNSDIKYYVYPATWPVLTPANAMLDATGSRNPIITSDGGQTLASNKMMVAHDFVRYLSLRLFNTPYATDLFNNTDVLLTDLRYISELNVWDPITTKITAVGINGTNANIHGTAGSKFMNNTNTTDANLCRELLLQLFAVAPQRFSDISNNITSTPQSLPFIAGDFISFKLTVQAASGQNNLTGVAAIEPRSYEIRLVFVSGSAVNTAVDTAENVGLP
jgi:hypothetical protein